MTMQKPLSRWFWFKAFWTFAPLVCAIILVIGGIFAINIRGLIIQSFVMAPLAFAFRGRLGTMFHNVTDLVYGKRGDNYKEKTRLYRLFMYFSGSNVSVRESAWVSIFDSLGLVFLFYYYFMGIYLQHIAT